MRTALIIITVCLFAKVRSSCNLFADLVTERWVAEFNLEDSGDSALDLAVDTAGNVYVTGRANEAPTHSNYATVKYDQAGSRLWLATHDGPASDTDSATRIAIAPSGDICVTGASLGIGTGRDFGTIKYDSDGNELWIARFNGSGNSIDEPTGIVIDPAGNIYVTGRTLSASTVYDFATIKYSPSGDETWVAIYRTPTERRDSCLR